MKRTIGKLPLSTSDIGSSSVSNTQQVEVVPSNQPLVENSLNYTFDIAVKFHFIERTIESGDYSYYHTLLTLKRVNKCFKQSIGACFAGILQQLYKPNDYPLSAFQILEHNNLFEAPSCFRAIQPLQQIQFWGSPEAKGRSVITLHQQAGSFAIIFDFVSTLRETLTLYFQAKSQLGFNPRDIACKTFVEIFESHLDTFKSLCQNTNFAFFFSTATIRERFFDQERWVVIPSLNINNLMDQMKSLFLDVNSPCSAYLFAHFLHFCAVSPKIFQFIQHPWENFCQETDTLENTTTHAPHIILSFFEKYSSYGFVSNTIKSFIKASYEGLSINNLQIVENSLRYLDEFTQRGWLDAHFIKKYNLVQKALNLLSHNYPNLQVNTLKLLYTLFKKEGLIDKSLITEFNLQQVLENLLVNPQVTVRGHAALLFLLLINNGCINDTSLITKFNLIEKIIIAKKELSEQLFEELASFTEINASLMGVISQYLTQVIPYLELDELCIKTGILFKFAKNSLLEKSLIECIIKDRKLDELLSDSSDNYILGFQFIKLFSKIQYIDQSLILNLNLIEKLLKVKGGCDDHVLFEYKAKIFVTWIRQFPEIAPHILAQTLKVLLELEKGYTEVKGETLWMLTQIIDANLMDHPLLSGFQLIETIIPFITASDLRLEFDERDTDDSNSDADGRFLAEEATAVLLEKLTTKDLLTQSKLIELQLVEKWFTQANFIFAPPGCYRVSHYIQEFFMSLINKSLITKSELITQSLQYLSYDDLRVKSNVIEFLKLSLPIVASLIQEQELISKLADTLPYFELDSKVGQNLCKLLRELTIIIASEKRKG